MDMPVKRAYQLYERIVENWSMWPIERKISRKTTTIHNVDTFPALVAQIEIITMKMDNLAQNVSMVHQPTPICGDYRQII